jgi:structural maintenance of chromosome 2
LNEEKANLSRFDNEISSLENAIKVKKDESANCDLELTKLEHSLQHLVKEQAAYSNRISELEKKHAWILEEKDRFDEYDLGNMDANQLHSKIDELKKSRDSKRKKLNPKVKDMLEEYVFFWLLTYMPC